jgi:hypothetical protein
MINSLTARFCFSKLYFWPSLNNSRELILFFNFIDSDSLSDGPEPLDLATVGTRAQ